MGVVNNDVNEKARSIGAISIVEEVTGNSGTSQEKCCCYPRYALSEYISHAKLSPKHLPHRISLYQTPPQHRKLLTPSNETALNNTSLLAPYTTQTTHTDNHEPQTTHPHQPSSAPLINNAPSKELYNKRARTGFPLFFTLLSTFTRIKQLEYNYSISFLFYTDIVERLSCYFTT